MTSNDSPTSHTWPERISGLYDWFARQRAEGGVSAGELPGTWNVFGYDDINAVFSDYATFSSDFNDFAPPDLEMDWFAKGNFFFSDPPRHRQLRGLVTRAFTPKLVATLEPRITAVATDLLDNLAGRDRIDLIGDFAYPLPAIVIAELIGVPTEDISLFRQWASAFVATQTEKGALATPEEVAAFKPTGLAMRGYLLDHVAKIRANPGQDLISLLVDARDESGNQLDDEEIISFVALLLTAGHPTTTGLIGNAVLCLDENPDAAGELRADRTLVPDALEEVVRLRPSLPRQGRLTTREVELGGQLIPPGQVLSLWVASANRDERHFTDPDRFDPRRKPNRHLSFGHGIHFCIGAPLARLESRIALNLLLDRYADIRVATDEPVEFHNPEALMGARQLPVTVTTA
ncbi:cytochrome P450 [Goodfellowiella coeruleoviolacea]|uniref:Cytochrome P450 n=1 Tax=Goodfellowiella coeruleoviolacea TaxID=334858 RepID=A0AAE3GHD6_9PSEU|nr:cytochrome P450 [Goodfellowiella coeruleoviolacea]MCP2167400.1 Cytochrome P450 [Goodfellowiella coeruleoviolacea]